MMRAAILLLLALLAGPVRADEFRPAYLQLTQRGAETYDVLWKVPALSEGQTLKVTPAFPPGTLVLGPRRTAYASGASVERWQIAVPGGLDGKPVTFDDLAVSRTDVIMRLARADGTEQIARIGLGSPAFIATPSPGRFEVVTSYTLLGIEHILTGVDHLLFVASLVMLVQGRRALLLTITAFTLAHSITLALATLDVVDVPGPPVEAVIALSIAFVAVEIVQRHRGHPSLASEKPWLVAFSFGLLHGLGFAGALAEVGLPPGNIPLALLFFNVGVEIGQLMFVTVLLAAAAALIRIRHRAGVGSFDPSWYPLLPAYAIGGISCFWLFERVAAFA